MLLHLAGSSISSTQQDDRGEKETDAGWQVPGELQVSPTDLLKGITMYQAQLWKSKKAKTWSLPASSLQGKVFRIYAAALLF